MKIIRLFLLTFIGIFHLLGHHSPPAGGGENSFCEFFCKATITFAASNEWYNRVYQTEMENELDKIPQPEDVRYIQDTLYVVGGKWKLPILYALGRGIHKFRAIQRSIPNITSRMLSKELKELELNGFIIRKNCDKAVDYEITDYCKSFEKIIKEMIEWGKNHHSHIKRVS